jgi:hypothetical protein
MSRLALASLCSLVWLNGCGDDASVASEGDPATEADCTCRLAARFSNLALCVSPTTAFAESHVYSTSWDDASGRPVCEPWQERQPDPAQPWSKVQISSACQGSGELCISIRAGDVKAISAEDCTLATRCTSIAYTTPNQIVDLAPLAGWSAQSSACALRHEQTGAYLELVVRSDTLGCGMGLDQVSRLGVCPARCRDVPSGPGCDVCGQGNVLTTF